MFKKDWECDWEKAEDRRFIRLFLSSKTKAKRDNHPKWQLPLTC